MNIEIENIGILKKARVTIDGLTVIAGENDTGKSTLSKVLAYGLTIMKRVKLNGEYSSTITFEAFADLMTATRIFGVDIVRGINVDYIKDSKISISIEEISINPQLGLEMLITDLFDNVKNIESIPDVVYVETPAIWSFIETFKNITQINQQMGIDVSHPYLMNDLSIKLSNTRANTMANTRANTSTSTIGEKSDISHRAKKIMNGEFKKDDRGIFYFERDGTRMELVNIATGIKYFGILQILSDNGWMASGNVVVLDEPEVHMHPKWQLQLAEIIVSLVKQGVKIIVNSHSPYMIEALKRYSDKEGLGEKSNFYLAKDGVIEDKNNLSEIFELLSEPFEIFREMDSEILKDE